MKDIRDYITITKKSQQLELLDYSIRFDNANSSESRYLISIVSQGRPVQRVQPTSYHLFDNNHDPSITDNKMFIVQIFTGCCDDSKCSF